METIVITDPDTDRYHTFGYISWWQQEVVRNATVLVVGAGALGNEVLKNLALMGIGNILIADFDTIEDSNLSRSVLFRESDRGRKKSEVAAEAVKTLNPDVNVKAWHGDINYELGLGVFRNVDVIIGCLDNREARLSINRFSWAINRPWVDGAIQELMGIVRVFWPGQGACYECTLTDLDYQIINLRYSCPLLARENILQGKVPTTPTSASIVAAFQTQEALKLIHDMEVQPGKAMMINGLTNDIYTTEYPIKDFCMSHNRLEPIEELAEATAEKTTLGQLLALAGERLGEGAVLEFDTEMVIAMHCPGCDEVTPIFKRMARLYENEFACPNCGERREMELTHRITGDENFLDRTLAEVDIPPLGIGGDYWRAVQFGASVLVWGVAVRTVLVWEITWSVNSVTHVWGYRNYRTRDNSRNNWLVGILALGEGWHNNHHAEPRCVAHGHRPWEFDPTYLVIRALEAVGLAKDLKTIPKTPTVPLESGDRARE